MQQEIAYSPWSERHRQHSLPGKEIKSELSLVELVEFNVPLDT